MELKKLLFLDWLDNTNLTQTPELIPERRLQKGASIYKTGETSAERERTIVPNRLVPAKEKDFRNGAVLYWERPIQNLSEDVNGFNYVYCPGLIGRSNEDGERNFTSLSEIPSSPPGYGLLYHPKGTKLKIDKGNIPEFIKLRKITYFDKLSSYCKLFMKNSYDELKVNIVGRTAHELKRYIQNVH
jgi:hypothetical protein